MSISLRRPATGQIKIYQEGWSWGCFFGSGVLGGKPSTLTANGSISGAIQTLGSQAVIPGR
jgi:hypothetical protein